MSCYTIIYRDGAKHMRPVRTKAEYLALRGSARQKAFLTTCRQGDDNAKRRLLQMNYSCIPNGDQLKGSTQASNSVGMDVDFDPTDPDYAQKMAEAPEKILAKKEELGLLMLERSCRKGYHLVFTRRPYLTQEDNLRWVSSLLGVQFDEAAKDITRVFYTTSESEEDLLFLDERLFSSLPLVCQQEKTDNSNDTPSQSSAEAVTTPPPSTGGGQGGGSASYLGIPYSAIISKWFELFNHGQLPIKSNRDVLTFELAVNLRHICGFDRELLDQIIPCFDGFPYDQKMKCIDSALAEKRTQMPKRLREVLTALKKDNVDNDKVFYALEEAELEDELYFYNRIPQEALARGVRDSIEAVGPKLIMPVLATVCPMIGALATHMRIRIHGKVVGLNMHTFIVGEAASNKGELDDVVEAWMAEPIAENEIFYSQENEYRTKKIQATNTKQQPEDPHLPVRFVTMNNTVPNLAVRLADTQGKHAFSYTPEADTVAARWSSALNDFSTMLRQSYDGSRYDREARSAEAVTVHIPHLYWNVCMCGTPDALYRVISNYTDGLLSRFIIAFTPDNTFSPLDDVPYMMTDEIRRHIYEVAHLLPLMQGTLDLPLLEARSRQWVEQFRRRCVKNDDKVMARARLRDHGTAVRMTTCLILCKVAEQLIEKHGLQNAERRLKCNPNLVQEMALDCQTPEMLHTYEILAETLIDNDMLFFRERLTTAYGSNNYARSARERSGKNDSIYDSLPSVFTFEQAMTAKGSGCTVNSVSQMLKNWRKQKLIELRDDNKYSKLT